MYSSVVCVMPPFPVYSYLWACVKAGLPDRPDHQKCGGKNRSGWERVTARSQGSSQLGR